MICWTIANFSIHFPRYGFKLMLDQMLLGEATTNAELQEYLEEYDRDWYIGLEKDPEWTAAILESRPNLFSLGHNNTQVGLAIYVAIDH